MNRRWDIDALRGFMLVAMTVTHLPTAFAIPGGQPFGFVSAAEGFVLLSAYMAGMVYTARAVRDGNPVMQEAFLRRALKIYACQAALLLFLFTVIAGIGVAQRQEAVTNMLSFYMEHPLTAFFSGLLLIYSPPLLDILPMYILLMLASPLLLLHGLHRGWLRIMVGSVALWVAAQFDLGQRLYCAVVGLTGLPVPFRETGSFELFAWQFLWVLGLWMGSTRAASGDQPVPPFPRWMLRTAMGVALVFFIWRHGIGQNPFLGDEGLNLLLDKWHLGPLRVINLFALVVLTVHYGPGLAARLPRMRWLETMGAASLPVFCAHLTLVLLALALLGESRAERPLWIDVSVLGVAFAGLYATAWVTVELGRRSAAVRQRMAAKTSKPLRAATATTALQAAPSATRSPPSTGRNPGR